jgi:hypothetical protein
MFVLAALIAVAAPNAAAQGAQRVDDGRLAIRAVGNGKFFIGDCTGKSVELSGDRQTIELLGACKSVVSHGNFTHITLDGASSLRVVGDGNVVKWKKKPARVDILGHNNLVTSS